LASGQATIVFARPRGLLRELPAAQELSRFFCLLLAASSVLFEKDRGQPKTGLSRSKEPRRASWHGAQRERQLGMEWWTMELLLISAALGLTGAMWVSRTRFTRRLNAALEAYAELEMLRATGQPRRD
jgi:hypothetical protein